VPVPGTEHTVQPSDSTSTTKIWTTSKTSLYCTQILLYQNHMCTMWSDNCLNKVCQSIIINLYFGLSGYSLSRYKYTSRLCLHWQKMFTIHQWIMRFLERDNTFYCWFLSLHQLSYYRLSLYKYCNWVPLDKSTPNLVEIQHDKHSQSHEHLILRLVSNWMPG